MESSQEEREVKSEELKSKLKKKKLKELKTGIIYLSRIPTLMNVKKVREIFSQYGDVGRIFLQPNEKASTNKKNRVFTEGWVEFSDKRIAKRVALCLNNQQIGGKRRSPWHEEIWNIKYLPKFKWAHLNERLAYERVVHKQRLRTEIAQAKKETSFYIQNVEKKQVHEKLKKKGKDPSETMREWSFRQHETEEDILAKKKRDLDADDNVEVTSVKKRKCVQRRTKVVESDKKLAKDHSFLKNIFSGGLNASSDEES